MRSAGTPSIAGSVLRNCAHCVLFCVSADAATTSQSAPASAVSTGVRAERSTYTSTPIADNSSRRASASMRVLAQRGEIGVELRERLIDGGAEGLHGRTD